MNETERFSEFVSSVTTIYKCIQRIKKQKISWCGLRGCDVMFLFFLSRAPEGMSAAALCRKTGEDKATASRVLGGLEDNGYVTYLPGAVKYRAPAILTEKGKAVTEEMNLMIADSVNEAGQDLTDEDRKAMYRSLCAIAGRLEKLVGENSDTQKEEAL